jgi:hypothetical protein
MIGRVRTGGRVLTSVPDLASAMDTLVSDTLIPFARFRQSIQRRRLLTALPVHNPWVMEISANDGHVNHCQSGP